MKRRAWICWMVLGIAGLILGATSPAMATFELALQEPGVNAGAITVVASGADFNPGGIMFSGVYGDYSVTIFGASSLNAAAGSNLLSSVVTVVANSAGTHSLSMYASQTNYNLPSGAFLMVSSGMGGTYGAELGFTSSAVFQMWADPNNQVLGMAGAFTNGVQTTTPPSNTGDGVNVRPFDTGTATNVFNRDGAPLYSLTSRVIFTTTGTGDVNDSNHIHVTPSVPEPISLILLGSGLAGAGIFRRLRRKS